MLRRGRHVFVRRLLGHGVCSRLEAVHLDYAVRTGHNVPIYAVAGDMKGDFRNLPVFGGFHDFQISGGLAGYRDVCADCIGSIPARRDILATGIFVLPADNRAGAALGFTVCPQADGFDEGRLRKWSACSRSGQKSGRRRTTGIWRARRSQSVTAAEYFVSSHFNSMGTALSAFSAAKLGRTYLLSTASTRDR